MDFGNGNTPPLINKGVLRRRRGEGGSQGASSLWPFVRNIHPKLWSSVHLVVLINSLIAHILYNLNNHHIAFKNLYTIFGHLVVR